MVRLHRFSLFLPQLEDGVDWWMEVIEWVIQRDQQDALIEKVRDDLLDNRNPELNSVARR